MGGREIPDGEWSDGSPTYQRPGYVVTTLDTVAPTPLTWLLPGRVPYGALTVLGGRPGGGKSQFALNLAAELAKSRVDSLIVGNEDGIGDTIWPRVRAHGAPLERIGVMSLQGDGVVQLPQDIDYMREAARQRGCALVIVDPIQAHFEEEINPNSDASVRRALAPLARMAQDTGAAVVLITHVRKSTEGGLLDRIGGSGGMGGAARSVILFGRQKNTPHWDDDMRYACQIKVNGARLAHTLKCRIDEQVVQHDGVDYPTSRLEMIGDCYEVSGRDLE